MALLDLQGMTVENGGGHGGNSSLSILCGKHSSHSTLLCL